MVFYTSGLYLLLIVTYSSYAFGENTGECPLGHNYAYHNGGYCCHSAEEANRPEANDDPPCDGGQLDLDSRCCKDDDYVKCPHDSCRSIERSTCYFDGNIVAVGLPLDKFETWCLDHARFSDETDFWTVTEAFKGETDGWVVVGGCEYTEDRKMWSCSRNRVSAGSNSNRGSSTAGLTQALTRPPSRKRCNPPRTWIRSRGRLVCRRKRRGGRRYY